MPTRRKRKPTPPKPARPREEWYAGRVLALDPSTRAIGAALFDGGELESVKLFAASNKDQWSRLNRMHAELERWIDGVILDSVVLEVGGMLFQASYGPKGKTRGIRVRADTIITLALAQGWLMGQLQAALPRVAFHPIPAHEWTREIPKESRRKEQRAKALAKECKLYRSVAAHDKGFDVADAIGVGRYFLSHYPE
jgi:hypothetical protein